MTIREEQLIRVIVKDLATNTVVHDRIVDYAFRNDRAWIAKTSTWALNNNHSVFTTPNIEE